MEGLQGKAERVSVFVRTGIRREARNALRAIFNLVIPAQAGIQKRSLRRNAPPFFDWPPFGWRKRTGFPPSRE
jgi:hypothetical protein